MTETLLTTKLYIPPIRPEIVPRPRLIEKLNEGLNRKLTLISAPAGFGKSTLVTEWISNLRLKTQKESRTEYKIAWLSLDNSDNDPTRFLSYFIAALNQIEGIDTIFGKEVQSILQSPQPLPTEIVVTFLINEIAAISPRIVFVLDDYHLLESQPIHYALTYLLDHLPPQLHLVVATREDPQLPLARMRSQDQITEIRAADLRFTSYESTEFLNQVMSLDLSIDDIAIIENRTEGWIAGLQLAAISLQGKEDTSGLIKSFSGSHRLVLDYLIEEVLDKQSESVQTFLMQTAILNQLTGSLCDALTDQGNGQQILENLEQANLFIIPLDNNRHWYRYHHLFADLLRQRLGQKQQDLTLTLHCRASAWYEQNGFANEAIEHAMHADDFERAANLLEEQVDELWGNGEHSILKRWLAKFPSELLFSKPHLCVFDSWYHFASGNQDAADHGLKAAEAALEVISMQTSKPSLLEHNGLLPDTKMRNLQGKIFAIRAFMDSYRGDVSGMILNAQQALEYLPDQDIPMRSFATMALGDAHTIKGEMKAAYNARIQALEISRSNASPYFLIAANLKMIATQKSLGQLHRAADICQQQYKLAEASGLSQVELVGLLLAEWGEVLAELNDLDGAIDRAEKGVELTERGLDLSVLGRSYRCMMRV
ncbi:MAG: hypothetical protein MUO76_08320, partial [Anaerolineaceae bacterium]|nr:hypothetical protein [Anaerolineaceae bacterium]